MIAVFRAGVCLLLGESFAGAIRGNKICCGMGRIVDLLSAESWTIGLPPGKGDVPFARAQSGRGILEGVAAACETILCVRTLFGAIPSVLWFADGTEACSAFPINPIVSASS